MVSFNLVTKARSVTNDVDKLQDRTGALKGELLSGEFEGPRPSPLALSLVGLI